MLGPELYSSIMLGLSQFLLVQKDYSTEWWTSAELDQLNQHKNSLM